MAAYIVGDANVKVAYLGEMRYRRGAVCVAERLIGEIESDVSSCGDEDPSIDSNSHVPLHQQVR